MNNLLDRLFSTKCGIEVYKNALSAISDYGMQNMISRGILVGLSGGADSVMLLLVLLKYREQNDFKIKAVHVNHLIRGAEADRDERFSLELCKSLGVEFESFHIDVPKIAEEQKIGMEEAARNERYKVFAALVASDSSISSIAVAHNATDNLETVIFNIMRGAGTLGASGISPVRDNVIRPLIYSPKRLIVSALEEAEIDFVTDSTNNLSDYSRNYIRNEILPHLSRISDSPEEMGTRFSKNLREDSDFILSLAERFISENEKNGSFAKESFLSLEKPVFSRVLTIMCKKAALPAPEKIHIDSIFALCRGGDFSFSLPGGVSFVSREGRIYIGEPKTEKREFFFPLKEGLNTFSGFDSAIIISKEKVIEQAKEYENTFEREFAYLLVHGVLHLLGYDHMEDEEKTVMRKNEEEILSELNLSR